MRGFRLVKPSLLSIYRFFSATYRALSDQPRPPGRVGHRGPVRDCGCASEVREAITRGKIGRREAPRSTRPDVVPRTRRVARQKPERLHPDRYAASRVGASFVASEKCLKRGLHQKHGRPNAGSADGRLDRSEPDLRAAGTRGRRACGALPASLSDQTTVGLSRSAPTRPVVGPGRGATCANRSQLPIGVRLGGGGSSRPYAATICTPIGRPSAMSAGTVRAGCPVELNGAVRRIRSMLRRVPSAPSSDIPSSSAARGNAGATNKSKPELHQAAIRLR